jgi:predicted amidohydrolase
MAAYLSEKTETSTLTLALIQMTSGKTLEENFEFLSEHIDLAVKQGATYVQSPENSLLMELNPKEVARITQSETYKDALQQLFLKAAAHKIWLHIGSAAVPLANQNIGNGKFKFANRSYLVGPDYSPTTAETHSFFYDKIHMFDVTLPNGEHYNESASYQAGETSVVVGCDFNSTHTPQNISAKLGMTICYDLRFPALFRHLARSDAEIISVPAAFTKTTGEAHWHVLLRARAIETGCFIVAAGQTGKHDNGRETFGHSLVISPWGDSLLDAGTDPGVYSCQIDLRQVERTRQIVPSLSHGKDFQ